MTAEGCPVAFERDEVPARRRAAANAVSRTRSGTKFPSAIVVAAQRMCDEFLVLVVDALAERNAQRYAAVLLTGAHGAGGLESICQSFDPDTCTYARRQANASRSASPASRKRATRSSAPSVKWLHPS